MAEQMRCTAYCWNSGIILRRCSNTPISSRRQSLLLILWLCEALVYYGVRSGGVFVLHDVIAVYRPSASSASSASGASVLHLFVISFIFW